MTDLPNLESEDLKNKKVILRYECDVRVSEDNKILDETRLISGFSTIEYLLQNNCEVIIIGHLRRPEGWDEKYSLLPVAKWFAREFQSQEAEAELGKFKGWKIKKGLTLLENLRFFKEEKENDPRFAKELASLGEIYVNEAFGSSHRKHASIVGIPKLLPSFPGFHFTKEVRVLDAVINLPINPLTIILGGAKMETKLPLVSRMHKIADHILIGGKLTDQDRTLIEAERIKSEKAKISVARSTMDGMDIEWESLKEFEDIISKSAMIVWNGPMGYIEGGFEESTLSIAQAIVDGSAYRISGGGDTVAFLNKHKLFDKFDFVSMGGGAMLEFLSGESLPGVVALQNNS